MMKDYTENRRNFIRCHFKRLREHRTDELRLHRPGSNPVALARLNNHESKQTHTFLDDLVGAIAASASARIAHSRSFGLERKRHGARGVFDPRLAALSFSQNNGIGLRTIRGKSLC